MKEEWGKIKKEKDWLGRDQYVVYKNKEKEETKSDYDYIEHEPYESEHWFNNLILFPLSFAFFGLIGGCFVFPRQYGADYGLGTSFKYMFYSALTGSLIGLIIGVCRLVRYYKSKPKN